MYFVERQHRRLQQIERFIDREHPMLLGIVRKVLALEVLHDDIRRAVLLEIVAQGDDVALADKLGESPGFLKETGLAYLKGIALYLRRREYGQ